MAEPLLQLNEFFVEGENQEISHVLLHITEPSTAEEKQKGYFFAVCEINGATEEYLASIQGAIDEIEKGYYELSEDDGKNALEKILEKINERSPALITAGVELNCVVGALRQPEIIFATSGNPTLLLFYKTRQGAYRSMELAQNAEQPSENPQLFSQLVEGKISPQDYLFVATPHVQKFFNADRLEKIITTRPPRQSAEHLERALRNMPSGYSFGGLIIHVAEAVLSPNKKPRPISARGSEESLHTLFKTESSTSETLSPSIFGKMKEGVRSQMTHPPAAPTMRESAKPKPEINAPHLHQYRRTEEPGSQSIAALMAVGRAIAVAAKAVFGAIVGVVRVLFLFIWRIIQTIGLAFVAAFNISGRRTVILEDWRREWRYYKRSVVELPLITKIIIAGAVLVAAVFLGSIWFLRASQQRASAVRAYNETIQNITTKTDAAESALVYKNEASALSELLAAKDLAQTLPCHSPDQKKTCDELNTKITGLLARARRITTLEPNLLVTWPSAITHLIKINTKLVGFGATTSLYSFELLSAENKTVAGALPADQFFAGAVPKENDYAVLLGASNQFLSLSPSDLTSKPLDISFPGSNASIASLNVYNRRMYTLDAGRHQIYKHDATSGGFGPAKPWLKDASSSLEGAVDLTIDGDVFVLTNSGNILKFTAGSAAQFNVSALDPALSGSSTLWTYNDLTYLYVLDSANKRLVILTKDGQLKTQITANAWSNPTDMIIDEPGKTAYIIDRGKVYKITLPI
jgi:hypothetical protein